MELFHKYYGSQCQFALDLMAQSAHRGEFTFAELLRLATHDHAGGLGKQMIDELVNAGVLMRSENNTYRLGESMRPFRAPLPLLERSYLAYLCMLPEAELFLPPETLARIRDHCGDIDWGFFAPFRAGVRPQIENVLPEAFRPILTAIAQRKYVNYLYCSQNADTWIPAEDMIPFRLEHSVLDGRWWVIVYLPDQDRPVKARLERIKDVQAGQAHHFTEKQMRAVIRRLVEPDPVVLHIRPEKNALERAFLIFENALDLAARQLEDGTYELSFSLFHFDRQDVLKKLLFLGEYVTLTAPESLLEDMRQRLESCLSPR